MDNYNTKPNNINDNDIPKYNKIANTYRVPTKLVLRESL